MTLVLAFAAAFAAALGQTATFSARQMTAGWGDGTAAQNSIYPYAGIVWSAKNCGDSAFKVFKVGGAEGNVRITGGVIRIERTNCKGCIIVEGPSLPAKNGAELRLAADVEVSGSIGDSCHGFLRAHGKVQLYKPSETCERDFMAGGIPQSWGLPNSPKGRTYRKYGRHVVKDGTIVPVIVIDGGMSVSTWSNWVVMDMREENETWREQIKPFAPKIRDSERQDETTYDASLSKDIQHTAKVVRENGVSRLYVDGRAVVPAAYKGPHGFLETTPEYFAGGTLQKTGIPFALKDIRLGKVPGARGYWTKDGFDAESAVREIKNSMRLAPTMPFAIAVGCNAYPEFARDEHPGEAMRRKDGSVVLGTSGSCLTSYCITDVEKKNMWPWPSYSSRIWRDGVKDCLRKLVAELRRQGLDRRIVGIHTFGYHDGQFTSPFADYSQAAKTEYEEYLKESGHAATNYEFFALQTGLRAQEEFVREFKRLMGKDVVGIMWCQNPISGSSAASYNLGGFLRSDAIDILVAQPSYVQRLPGLPGASHLPTASFNLHGKLYFEELDFRTYASIQQWTSSPASAMGLGTSEDFPMWQTVFRKHAGAMIAQRAGWWFYDMAGGWFSAPEIVDDIKTAITVYEKVVFPRDRNGRLRPPSPWKPGAAIVVDEAGRFGWPEGDTEFRRQLDFSYFRQLYILPRSGVPFDIYLLQDVLENPSLMDPYRLVAFGLMRKYDKSRINLVKRLARSGRTLVHMPCCGELGGIEKAVGISLRVNEKASHVVVAEPCFPVEVNGLHYHDMLRKCDPLSFPPAHMADWPRNSVVEKKGLRVLARYAADGAPAAAVRDGDGFRHVVFTEAGGISGAALNRLAGEAGAYVALPPDVAQVEMNGDFISIHALKSGGYSFRLPFNCTVRNLKSGCDETIENGCINLRIEVGGTYQFLLNAH